MVPPRFQHAFLCKKHWECSTNPTPSLSLRPSTPAQTVNARILLRMQLELPDTEFVQLITLMRLNTSKSPYAQELYKAKPSHGSAVHLRSVALQKPRLRRFFQKTLDSPDSTERKTKPNHVREGAFWSLLLQDNDLPATPRSNEMLKRLGFRLLLHPSYRIYSYQTCTEAS